MGQSQISFTHSLPVLTPPFYSILLQQLSTTICTSEAIRCSAMCMRWLYPSLCSEPAVRPDPEREDKLDKDYRGRRQLTAWNIKHSRSHCLIQVAQSPGKQAGCCQGRNHRCSAVGLSQKKLLSPQLVQSTQVTALDSKSTYFSLTPTYSKHIGSSDPALPLHPQVIDFNPISTTQKPQASNLYSGLSGNFAAIKYTVV